MPESDFRPHWLPQEIAPSFVHRQRVGATNLYLIDARTLYEALWLDAAQEAPFSTHFFFNRYSFTSHINVGRFASEPLQRPIILGVTSPAEFSKLYGGLQSNLPIISVEGGQRLLHAAGWTEPFAWDEAPKINGPIIRQGMGQNLRQIAPNASSRKITIAIKNNDLDSLCKALKLDKSNFVLLPPSPPPTGIDKVNKLIAANKVAEALFGTGADSKSFKPADWDKVVAQLTESEKAALLQRYATMAASNGLANLAPNIETFAPEFYELYKQRLAAKGFVKAADATSKPVIIESTQEPPKQTVTPTQSDVPKLSPPQTPPPPQQPHLPSSPPPLPPSKYSSLDALRRSYGITENTTTEERVIYKAILKRHGASGSLRSKVKKLTTTEINDILLERWYVNNEGFDGLPPPKPGYVRLYHGEGSLPKIDREYGDTTRPPLNRPLGTWYSDSIDGTSMYVDTIRAQENGFKAGPPRIFWIDVSVKDAQAFYWRGDDYTATMNLDDILTPNQAIYDMGIMMWDNAKKNGMAGVVPYANMSRYVSPKRAARWQADMEPLTDKPVTTTPQIKRTGKKNLWRLGGLFLLGTLLFSNEEENDTAATMGMAGAGILNFYGDANINIRMALRQVAQDLLPSEVNLFEDFLIRKFNQGITVVDIAQELKNFRARTELIDNINKLLVESCDILARMGGIDLPRNMDVLKLYNGQFTQIIITQTLFQMIPATEYVRFGNKLQALEQKCLSTLVTAVQNGIISESEKDLLWRISGLMSGWGWGHGKPGHEFNNRITGEWGFFNMADTDAKFPRDVKPGALSWGEISSRENTKSQLETWGMPSSEAAQEALTARKAELTELTKERETFGVSPDLETKLITVEKLEETAKENVRQFLLRNNLQHIEEWIPDPNKTWNPPNNSASGNNKRLLDIEAEVQNKVAEVATDASHVELHDDAELSTKQHPPHIENERNIALTHENRVRILESSAEMSMRLAGQAYWVADIPVDVAVLWLPSVRSITTNLNSVEGQIQFDAIIQRFSEDASGRGLMQSLKEGKAIEALPIGTILANGQIEISGTHKVITAFKHSRLPNGNLGLTIEVAFTSKEAAIQAVVTSINAKWDIKAPFDISGKFTANIVPKYSGPKRTNPQAGFIDAGLLVDGITAIGKNIPKTLKYLFLTANGLNFSTAIYDIAVNPSVADIRRNVFDVAFMYDSDLEKYFRLQAKITKSGIKLPNDNSNMEFSENDLAKLIYGFILNPEQRTEYLAQIQALREQWVKYENELRELLADKYGVWEMNRFYNNNDNSFPAFATLPNGKTGHEIDSTIRMLEWARQLITRISSIEVIDNMIAYVKSLGDGRATWKQAQLVKTKHSSTRNNDSIQNLLWLFGEGARDIDAIRKNKDEILKQLLKIRSMYGTKAELNPTQHNSGELVKLLGPTNVPMRLEFWMSVFKDDQATAMKMRLLSSLIDIVTSLITGGWIVRGTSLVFNSIAIIANYLALEGGVGRGQLPTTEGFRYINNDDIKEYIKLIYDSIHDTKFLGIEWSKARRVEAETFFFENSPDVEPGTVSYIDTTGNLHYNLTEYQIKQIKEWAYSIDNAKRPNVHFDITNLEDIFKHGTIFLQSPQFWRHTKDWNRFCVLTNRMHDIVRGLPYSHYKDIWMRQPFNIPEGLFDNYREMAENEAKYSISEAELAEYYRLRKEAMALAKTEYDLQRKFIAGDKETVKQLLLSDVVDADDITKIVILLRLARVNEIRKKHIQDDKKPTLEQLSLFARTVFSHVSPFILAAVGDSTETPQSTTTSDTSLLLDVNKLNAHVLNVINGDKPSDLRVPDDAVLVTFNSEVKELVNRSAILNDPTAKNEDIQAYVLRMTTFARKYKLSGEALEALNIPFNRFFPPHLNAPAGGPVSGPQVTTTQPSKEQLVAINKILKGTSNIQDSDAVKIDTFKRRWTAAVQSGASNTIDDIIEEFDFTETDLISLGLMKQPAPQPQQQPQLTAPTSTTISPVKPKTFTAPSLFAGMEMGKDGKPVIKSKEDAETVNEILRSAAEAEAKRLAMAEAQRKIDAALKEAKDSTIVSNDTFDMANTSINALNQGIEAAIARSKTHNSGAATNILNSNINHLKEKLDFNATKEAAVNKYFKEQSTSAQEKSKEFEQALSEKKKALQEFITGKLDNESRTDEYGEIASKWSGEDIASIEEKIETATMSLLTYERAMAESARDMGGITIVVENEVDNASKWLIEHSDDFDKILEQLASVSQSNDVEDKKLAAELELAIYGYMEKANTAYKNVQEQSDRIDKVSKELKELRNYEKAMTVGGRKLLPDERKYIKEERQMLIKEKAQAEAAHQREFWKWYNESDGKRQQERDWQLIFASAGMSTEPGKVPGPEPKDSIGCECKACKATKDMAKLIALIKKYNQPPQPQGPKPAANPDDPNSPEEQQRIADAALKELERQARKAIEAAEEVYKKHQEEYKENLKRKLIDKFGEQQGLEMWRRAMGLSSLNISDMDRPVAPLIPETDLIFNVKSNPSLMSVPLSVFDLAPPQKAVKEKPKVNEPPAVQRIIPDPTPAHKAPPSLTGSGKPNGGGAPEDEPPTGPKWRIPLLNENASGGGNKGSQFSKQINQAPSMAPQSISFGGVAWNTTNSNVGEKTIQQESIDSKGNITQLNQSFGLISWMPNI
jgi:hypothetical protein